jgi:PIN domain nuclease of toxin-antitoxin system
VDERLVGVVIAYLDTHVVVWLCENNVRRLSDSALTAINEYDLLISPAVLIELNFLFQIQRILRAPLDLAKQLRTQLSVEVCGRSFADVAETALFESWTRDPFDLLIVAHAKANNYSPLITQDEKIRQNYPRSIW